MPDFLFDHSLQIYKEIMKSDHIFLFSDYDGTLVHFKDKPTEVTTPEKIKTIIRKLIINPKIMMIIVTGRSLQDIKKLLDIKGLHFIALHGLCIETSTGEQFKWKQAEQTLSLIKIIKKNMQYKLRDEKEVFLEDKEFTLVFHYRLAPKDKIQIWQKKFKEIVKKNDKKKILEIIHGEKVLEARPKGWNKGKAIESFITRNTSAKNILSIYIGDDITDEDAFRFLGKRGISIYVENKSKRKTLAHYWVKNPDEVESFLQSLTQWLCID